MYLLTMLMAGMLIGQPETATTSGETPATCWFGDAYAAAGGELCPAEEAETVQDAAPADPVPSGRWASRVQGRGQLGDGPPVQPGSTGGPANVIYMAAPESSEAFDAEEAPPARNGCERTQSERRDPVTGAVERSVGISCTGGSDDPRAREELERVQRGLRGDH